MLTFVQFKEKSEKNSIKSKAMSLISSVFLKKSFSHHTFSTHDKEIETSKDTLKSLFIKRHVF